MHNLFTWAVLLAATGTEAADNRMAPLSLHSCCTALQWLVQLLLLEITFLLYWRGKSRLYFKFGMVEVSAGSR